MLTRFKEKYIGDAAFYKRYLYLALPMILQNAITNLVSFLDNIMVGQLGTEQMSGVAIVNQLIFVYNLAIFGAASAASIFGAQYSFTELMQFYMQDYSLNLSPVSSYTQSLSQ